MNYSCSSQPAQPTHLCPLKELLSAQGMQILIAWGGKPWDQGQCELTSGWAKSPAKKQAGPSPFHSDYNSPDSCPFLIPQQKLLNL